MLRLTIKIRKCFGQSGKTVWWIYFFALCFSGMLLTKIGATDVMLEMVTVIVTIIGTVGVFRWFWANEKDKTAAFLMFCGYMVRVAYRYGTESGILVLSYTSAPSDATHFWETSSNLYFGLHSDVILTEYPYLLRDFYKVFGNNKLVAVYINILFWALSSVILMNLARAVRLSGIRKYILYGIWGILPSSILVGTDLLRENIMVFFDMWSFYIFLMWMKNGKKLFFTWAFLLVAPAAYLHTASISLWAAYIVIAAFWDKKEKRYIFSRKTMGLLCMGMLGGGCILFSPLRNIFGSYIGSDISLYAITHRPIPIGGSDYLGWMDCQNWLQFIPYTFIRVFYFLFAPLPQEARGMVDILSFITDGLLVFILLIYMWHKLWDRKKRAAICAAFVCIMALAGIFAWGVRNSGTAIRHRMLLWGILIMGVCIAMGRIEEQHEKNCFFSWKSKAWWGRKSSKFIG